MFTWVWSGVLMLPLVLINSSPNLIAQPVHAPLSFLHANLALYSPVNMVRPRQRMLSHRGSNQKGSSRPSTETETFPHGHCHCHCPHSGGASPLRHSQYLEVSSHGSSSSPFFSSTAFTFNKTLNCPQINTHVSMLFIDEVQDEDGTSAHQEFTSPVNIVKAYFTCQHCEGYGTALYGQWEDNRKATKRAKQEAEKYGWYPIVEEVPKV